MEEFVGKLWHNLVTKAAGGSYPEAAVSLADMEKTVGIFFRGLGGDKGLKVAAAVKETHGARRRWLQRLAASGEKAPVSRRDQETLRLPAEIAVFPQTQLNRDLYLWLAALAASGAGADQPWLIRNQMATADVLQEFPGLAPRYQRLVAALMQARIPPESLPADEAAQESALRLALQSPGAVTALPPLTQRKAKPHQPLPLWLGDPLELPPSQSTHAEGEMPPEGGGGQSQQKDAYKAEQVELPKNENAFLMSFRAESIPTWAEYIKANRAFDDDPNPDAKEAAKDLDHLSLAQDGQTAATRVKFDLDLPAAAEDDTPIGPGIQLPEWDYRKGVMLENYCLLQPLLAQDAQPSPLPEELRLTARRLKGQFAALAPQRRWLRAQPDGPELDIDACVRAQSDRRAGQSPETGGYLAQARCERDMACLLLADLSLSTDAWISDHKRIVDVIRDSLLLCAEALSATGDKFGIYGFSSLKRQNVRFHVFKDFNRPYDAMARGRILALKPGFYTRMGAAIRQATAILGEQAAARRLLLIISDGKPNDLDLYDSRYGIEDTRMAVAEARREGLTPFCVTIDREAGSYLPHLFGPAGFCVIRQPEELPKRLPLLYAQLTRS